MREFSIEEGLKKRLEKLYTKDRSTYDAVLRKIEEILQVPDMDHYKNLRRPLQQFKRVHVRGPFVLIFKVKGEKVIFYEMDHHDAIYFVP